MINVNKENDGLSFEDLPNELLYYLYSYITDPKDILHMRLVNCLQLKLCQSYIHTIRSKCVSSKLILTLPSVESVNGVVNVYDEDTIMQLVKHPSLKRITMQYVNEEEDQCKALNIYLNNKHNVVNCNVSVEYPKKLSFKNGIKTVGIKHKTMYVKSNHCEDSMYNFASMKSNFGVLKNFDIDTLITDAPLVPIIHEFAPNIETLVLSYRNFHQKIYTIISSVIVKLCNDGQLKYVKIVLPKEHIHLILKYSKWLNVDFSAPRSVHRLCQVNKPVYLDVPLFAHANLIDNVLEHFTNLPLIALGYEYKTEEMINKLDKILSREDIKSVIIYSNVPVDIPERYMTNPRINIKPYSVCPLSGY